MREHSLQAPQLAHLGKGRSFDLGRRVEVLAVVVVVVVVDVVLGISSIVVGRVASSAMSDFSSGVVVQVDVVVEGGVGVVSDIALSKRIPCCALLGPVAIVGSNLSLPSPIILALIELVSFSVYTSFMLEFCFPSIVLFMRHKFGSSKVDFHFVYFTPSDLCLLCSFSHS